MHSVAHVAAEFGVSPRAVHHWIESGCPVIRRGRRGNGGSHLLDMDQVRAWRQAQHQRDADGAVIEIAGLLPHLLADACAQAAQEATGPHKLALHGALAEAWHTATVAALAALREQYPVAAHLIRDPSVLPEPIFRLAQVNRHADGDLRAME